MKRDLPYASATAGARALQELQSVLEAFGCSNFGTMVDAEAQIVTVAFKWKGQQVRLDASWKGYAAAWIQRHPYKYRYSYNRSDHEARALAQARISVCSVLRDWAKGQIIAVECGIMKFDEIFMPHMLTNQGIRVIDVARQANILPQIGHESGT